MAAVATHQHTHLGKSSSPTGKKNEFILRYFVVKVVKQKKQNATLEDRFYD